MINVVKIAKQAQKDLKKIPSHIADKLDAWIHDIELRGVEEVRKISGYHDEPLKGDRSDQRSIRLSKHYRTIYVIKTNHVEFIEIQEVTKHEY